MGNLSNSVGRVFGLAAAILVLTSWVATDSWAATWTEINTGLPSALVDVSAIVIAPTAPSTIYALTSGGVFKTTDGAGRWTTISSVVGVNLLVVDPTNSSTIYALAGGGILKSTNGGESWDTVNTGLPPNDNTFIRYLVIDPTTPSTIYAIGSVVPPGGPASGFLLKSTDEGASWNALNNGLPPDTFIFISSLVIDPTTPSTIYATGSSGFLKSTNGGENWSVAGAGLSSIITLAIDAITPATLYAAAFGVGGAGIFKSTNGGGSWNALNTGLPQNDNTFIGSLVIDPTTPSTIYASGSVAPPGGPASGFLLKSTDGGARWKALDAGLSANSSIRPLAIAPTTPSIIYAKAFLPDPNRPHDRGIFKSTDGGASWNGASTGLTTIDVRALAVNRVDPATVYAGAGDSVFKSVDSGASWSKLFAFQLFISFPLPSLILFPPFPDGAPAYPRSLLIDFFNPNILYAATFRDNGCYFADNLLFKSTDGGVSWSDSVSPDKSGCVLGGDSELGPSSGLKAMDPIDPNTLYVAEADDEDGGYWLLRSKDAGASWTTIWDFAGGLQAGVWALAIDPANPATLYAGLDDVPVYSQNRPGLGGLFKSTDGGANWNRIGLSGSAVNLLAIDPTQPSVLYAGTEGNYGAPRGFRGLFKSTDSGASWSAIGNGLASLPDADSSMTAIVIDPANSNILYAGTSGSGVFKSSDGGANWSRFNDGLANLDVRVLAVAPGSRHNLYAGTEGGVFKIIDDAP